MKPSAPQAVRTAIEWLLNPERLLPGSVLVLLVAVGLAASPRLSRELSPLESFPVPQGAVAAIHSASPLDFAAWQEIIGNFLPAESLDLFASAAAEGVLDAADSGEAEVIVFGGREEGYSAAILIPRQERGETDAGLETAAAAAQAPLLPLIRKVRLPDNSVSLEITQDPALFRFETVSVAGRSARALRLPGSGLAYLSDGRVTALAITPKTLEALFAPRARGLLRLCPARGSITLRLRTAGGWQTAPRAVFRLFPSPFLVGFPPLIYLPNIIFAVHTPIRTFYLQKCSF